MTELAEWDSFYLIVGPAAGALIGLQFVVMTLIADRRRKPGIEVGAAFATPNIVHFCAALFLSAIVRVPWRSMTTPAVVWGLVGLAGVVYSISVIWMMRKQKLYDPVFEDWLFHGILPLAAYAALAAATILEISDSRDALFGVGGSTLLLLLIGIHNSWDTVTFNVFEDTGKTENPDGVAGRPEDQNEPKHG